MSRNVNQVLWGQWRQRVERQRTSGLSIAEFCRREGVSAVTFYTWRRKLRSAAVPERAEDQGAEAVAPRRRSGPPRADTVAPARSGTFLQLPLLAAGAGPCIEVALVEGTLVRIPPQNLAALQTVLTILCASPVPARRGEVPDA